MKKLFSLFIISVFIFGNTELVDAQTFSDIPENSKYYQAAEYLSSKGIINGYKDGTFKPYSTINRAEFTKIVLLSEYSQEEINNIHPQAVTFDDVNGSHLWFFNYITFAEENKIIKGYNEKNGHFTFRPNNNITKGEASKIIVNTLLNGKNKNISEESWCGGWWCNYVEEIRKSLKKLPLKISNSLAIGTEDYADNLLYSGNKPITRGEMVELIYLLKNAQNSSAEVSRGNNENTVNYSNIGNYLYENFEKLHPKYSKEGYLLHDGKISVDAIYFISDKKIIISYGGHYNCMFLELSYDGKMYRKVSDTVNDKCSEYSAEKYIYKYIPKKNF